MAMTISGTSGVTFPDSSVQAVTATNATNITTGTLPKARLAAGTVLQVVNATYATQLSTSSTSYVDTGLSASITPTSATSKILIFVDQTGVGKNAGDSSQRVALNIVRNSTQLIQFELGAGYTGSSVVNVFGGSGANYLDSPASTSSITYKTQIKGFAGVNVYANYDNCTSTITLMEIAA
jgi:hypothetical protein